MKFQGFYFAKESFADNRRLYNEAKAKGENNRLGMTQKELESHIDLLTRFPPEQSHRRMVAQKVEVYSILAPKWEQIGERRVMIPKGSLEHIITVDFGDEIKKDCGLEIEEVLEKNIRFELPDGTFIKGDRIRTSRYPGRERCKEIDSEWFKVIFDRSHYEKEGYFHYELRLKTEEFTLSKVREYHITKYVKINDEMIREKKWFAIPLFESDNGHVPTKFYKLRCSATR